MRRAALVLLGIWILAGCSPKPAEAPLTVKTPPPSANRTPAAATQQGARSGQGGIAPIGGNLGGMTPVAGSDSVEGAGMGGIGNAAKDSARKAANQSQSTQPPGDGQE